MCGRKSQPNVSKWECTNIFDSRFGVKNRAHFLSVSNRSWNSRFSCLVIVWEDIMKRGSRTNVALPNHKGPKKIYAIGNDGNHKRYTELGIKKFTLNRRRRYSVDWRHSKIRAHCKREENIRSILFLRHGICTHRMCHCKRCWSVLNGWEREKKETNALKWNWMKK